MTSRFTPALMAVFLIAPSVVSASVIGGPVVNPANGHSYYLLSQNSWTASEAEAVALGGNLVTVNDAAEQLWLVSEFGPITTDISPNSFWIGLNDIDQEGTFVWSSGEPAGYLNWFPGEPNGGSVPGQDYAYIGRYSNGQWNDTSDIALDSSPQPQPRGVVEVSIPEPTTALLALVGLAALALPRSR